jgi:hypothetical protein
MTENWIVKCVDSNHASASFAGFMSYQDAAEWMTENYPNCARTIELGEVTA